MTTPTTGLLARLARVDGRLLLALLALALLAHVVYAFQGPDRYLPAWSRLGAFAMAPAFLDLRCLLAAVQTRDAGLDPLVRNPFDQDRRPILYPRVWVTLASLLPRGVSPLEVGFLLCICFLAALIAILPRLPAGETLLLAPLIFSPPLFLAVERGNNDLAVFILIALALLAIRLSWPLRAGAYGIVLLSAILKFYPVAALSLAMKETPRRFLAVLATVGGATAAYMVAIRSDIALISRQLFPGVAFSYGASTGPMWFDLKSRFAVGKGTFLLQGLAVLLPLLALAWLLARRGPRPEELDGVRRDGLLAGGALFLGTFLMGSNFDYRLVFLLPALPAVARWALGTGPAALSSRVALGLLLPYLWAPALSVWFFRNQVAWTDLVRSGIGYLLAGYFLWALLGVLPPWLGERLLGPGPSGAVGKGGR